MVTKIEYRMDTTDNKGLEDLLKMLGNENRVVFYVEKVSDKQYRLWSKRDK